MGYTSTAASDMTDVKRGTSTTPGTPDDVSTSIALLNSGRPTPAIAPPRLSPRAVA